MEFRPVDKRTWRDFEALFEGKGGPSYCWCMAWRSTPEGRAETNFARKSEMERRVKSGEPIGILGYIEGKPVAWCSIAPRPTYRALGGPPEEDEPESVWSLVCMYVRRDLRQQRIAPRLVEAAIDYARENGARILETYPVDPDSPSYRFGGFLSLYESAGFVEVGRAGSRRHVMRRSVR